MPNFQLLSLIALCTSVVSLVLCSIQQLRLRRERVRTEELLSSIADLEGQLTALRRATESATRTPAARRPIASDADRQQSPSEGATIKPSLTERRYRVLRLARRGLDARAISSMLNIPHGEVELIIGLSRAA
ncbi:hypothetical protein [Pyrinomonas sp.]|uniref:hypothetical protein n=1 Tax=Pyrinomonas sp. TaxID=2080306 RepID=UPI003329CABE